MSNREYKVFKNLVQRVYLRSSYSGPLIILIIHASALAFKTVTAFTGKHNNIWAEVV